MSIILNWVNFTQTIPDRIDIYRSDTRNGTYTLIDTAPVDALTYTDTTALDNKVYYYKVGNQVGNDYGMSVIVPLANFPITGPGPATLIRGDWEFGYFGIVLVSSGTVPTSAQLVTATGISYQVNSTLTQYHKCVVNGKIIFIPNRFYGTGAFYSVFGKMVSYPYGKDLVATGVTITNNGFTYLIRAPLASNKFTTEVNPNGDFTYTSLNGSVTQINTWDDTFTISEYAALLGIFQTGSLLRGLKTAILADDVNSVSYPNLPVVSNTYVDTSHLFGSFPYGGSITGQPNNLVRVSITDSVVLHPILVLQL